MEAFILAAVMYWGLTIVFSFFQGRLERRLSAGLRSRDDRRADDGRCRGTELVADDPVNRRSPTSPPEAKPSRTPLEQRRRRGARVGPSQVLRRPARPEGRRRWRCVAGEVVVVFGRSGSGKSTLLRCVNFLEDPTQGTIEVDGLVLQGGHRARRKREEIRQLRMRAGMVFQDFNLFPHLTALGNVMEGPATVKGMDAGRGQGDRPGAARARSGSPTRRTSTRSSSRAARSSGWRSRGRWRWSPRSCSSTSPPRPWTRS